MGDREPGAGLVAVGGVAVALCCGLPLLLWAGALGALAGIGLGNWLLIGAGVVIVAVGLRRRARHRRPLPQPHPLRDVEETTR